MVLKQVLAIAATSVGFSLFAPHAQAALITGVTATTDMGSGLNSSLDNAINGAGLPGDIPALTGQHLTGDNETTIWISDSNQETGNITFNLNGSFNLAGFSFWNLNTNSLAGIREVTIQSSTDGTNFTTIPGAPTLFDVGNFNAPQDPQLVNFTPVTTSFVRFVVQSNFDGNRTGFAEVQFNSFDALPTTPEPSVLLGLLAIGTVGAISRKPKK